MPINTKHGEEVEWGTEEDYDDVQWFKDPPPRQEPPSQPTSMQDPYVPLPSVVEENERFIFALRHAPNVLFSRFKQYGQLGVLGWCSEFSELIDNLKSLGFNGNMFVATRAQALQTCADILKLRLDIKMQIIIMFLSAQVARLRLFLDGETEFNDYPETDFPLETLI